MIPWRGESVTQLRPAKTAEQIEILFWVDTPGNPRYIVLDGGPDHLTDPMQLSPNYFDHLLTLASKTLQTGPY